MFPLKKINIQINDSADNFLSDYKDSTEIPLSSHPGSFAYKRKNHIHEGVDLYCQKDDEVFAIEDGIVIKIKPFTGTALGTTWWNDTWCVMVEGITGVFNYGEIIPNEKLQEGMIIKEGQLIGKVETILKKDKGRPMNMLHLELYKHGTKDAILGWNLEEEQPEQLLDPTMKLLQLAHIETHHNKRKIK